MIGSYEAWAYGSRAPRPVRSLERDAQTFLSGAFGPLVPIEPMPIDTVPPDTDLERPEPRRTEYPVGWNRPIGTPGTEGLKLAPFAQLRAYADLYSIIRAAIQIRKDELLGIDWEIVPTKAAQVAMRDNPAAQDDFDVRRQAMAEWFRRPDPSYVTFKPWFNALLEDIFVVDAACLYLHPSRQQGAGQFGSDLASLDLIDGTTIRPLLDMRGGMPRPPNPAYQQYIWGVPRSDLMTVISERDLDDLDVEPVDQYRGDELIYQPYLRRTWTPYGFPGIERALLPVVTGLKRQQFILEFFTEGSLPGMFVIPGPGIDTPEQMRKLQDTLNFVAGDQAWKHKIIVLPHGSTADPQKPMELATSFDEQLIVEALMAYMVDPGEVGMPMTSKARGLQIGGSAGAADSGDAARERTATKPMLEWMKETWFDYVIREVFLQVDMEWHWAGWQDIADDTAQKTLAMNEIAKGTKTIDEYRKQFGMQPFGFPITGTPILIQSSGPPVPLEGLDPDAIAEQSNEPPEQQPALPAGGERGSSKPAPSGKKLAQLGELEKLRRSLKNGRSPRDWKAEDLPAEVLDLVTRELDSGATYAKAIGTGRDYVDFLAKSDARSSKVTYYAGRAAGGLGQLAKQLAQGKISPITFVDEAQAKLEAGYVSAMQAGARQAAADHGVSAIRDFEKEAQARADSQHFYLQELARDVQSGTVRFGDQPVTAVSQIRDAFKGRMQLYGNSMIAAYEQGYAKTLLTVSATGWKINWLAAADSCEKCAELAGGGPYSPATLPGYPGDGGFGGALCVGGPNCRCILDWTKA